MALRYHPPGTRKGNRYGLARGRVAGRLYELVCRDDDGRPTADARAARRFIRRFESAARAAAGQGRGARAQAPAAAAGTFRAVADAYLAARAPGKSQRRAVERLCVELGDRFVDGIRPGDIAAAANALYPAATNATRNRQAYAPAAAVLHYAAENGLCAWLRIRKLPETQPPRRRIAAADMTALIDHAEGELRLLLVVLRWQGWRLSEALALSWDRDATAGSGKVELAAQRFLVWIPKRRVYKDVPMHPAVLEALAAVPEKKRRGRVFPWRTRWGVYRQLRALHKADAIAARGIRFTPHRARHSFASDLNDAGASTSDIAAAGTWTSPRTVERCYITVDMTRARSVIERLGGGEPVTPTRRRKGRVA